MDLPPLGSRAFGARPFRSKRCMSPNPLQWNLAMGLLEYLTSTKIYFRHFFYKVIHRSPKLLLHIWCLYTWLRTNAVYYKTLYRNLLCPWLFFRNKTCKTVLFHLLVQCLFLLLHVESWAISSIIERVIGSGRWGEVLLLPLTFHFL